MLSTKIWVQSIFLYARGKALRIFAGEIRGHNPLGGPCAIHCNVRTSKTIKSDGAWWRFQSSQLVHMQKSYWTSGPILMLFSSSFWNRNDRSPPNLFSKKMVIGVLLSYFVESYETWIWWYHQTCEAELNWPKLQSFQEPSSSKRIHAFLPWGDPGCPLRWLSGDMWGRSCAAVNENKVVYINQRCIKRCKHVVYMIWWCPCFQR